MKIENNKSPKRAPVSIKNTNKSTEKDKNLSQKNLRVIILILGFLAALGPFSIDTYLPAFPSIALDLHKSIAEVGLSLTSYLIGISTGQLIYGPIIDRYGRKKPLLFGISLYFISVIVCFLSSGLNVFIAARFSSALGSCVGMVAGRAIIIDLFPTSETARIFSLQMLIMGVAPIIAPTIGGFITANFGWRYIFLFLSVISFLVLLSIIYFLPESKGSDKSVSMKINSIISDYLAVLRVPDFVIYTLAGAIASSGLFAYISGSPFVYMELFGLSEKQYGIVFGINAMGLIAGSQFNRVLLKRFPGKKIILVGSLIQFIASLLLVTGNLSGLIYMSGTFFFIFVYLMINGSQYPNTSAFALEPFTKKIGSASAMMGFIQMVSGGITSAIVSYLQNGTQIPMISVILACSAISFSLVLYGNFRTKIIDTKA